MRPENLDALRDSGIAESDLLCLDDLPRPVHDLPEPAYALVDHNVLEQGSPSARVVSVIDHHIDEKRPSRYLAESDLSGYPDASPLVVRTSGSCASLVTSHFARQADALSPLMPRELADLLIGAILIDTADLRPAPKGKAEDVDRDAMALLVPLSSAADSTSLIAAVNSSKARNTLSHRFERLAAAKESVGHVRRDTTRSL